MLEIFTAGNQFTHFPEADIAPENEFSLLLPKIIVFCHLHKNKNKKTSAVITQYICIGTVLNSIRWMEKEI